MPKTNFSSLPYELHQHILSYVVDRELRSPITRNSDVKTIFKFQSLNKKMNSTKEMEEFYNKFWWKLFERDLGIHPKYATEFDGLRIGMIEKGELKRKVLMALYAKFKLLRQQRHDKNNTEEIKVVMVGQGSVGKSALTIRFMQDVFVEEYDPTIEDVYRKLMDVDGIPVFFDVLDTAGPEEYSAMRDQYMRTGQCFVMTCSLSSRNSLEELEVLCEQLVRVKDMESNEMPIVFALNKVDLVEKETNGNQIIQDYSNEIQKIIEKLQLLNTTILTSSAKTGMNVNVIFQELTRLWRYGSIHTLQLLQDIIEKDVQYIEQLKKSMGRSGSKKCLVM